MANFWNVNGERSGVEKLLMLHFKLNLIITSGFAVPLLSRRDVCTPHSVPPGVIFPLLKSQICSRCRNVDGMVSISSFYGVLKF